MLEFADINDFLQKTNNLHELYNIFRVVDPVSKKVEVIKSQDNILPTDAPCYEVWKTGKVCDNCISMRAMIERKVVLKMGNLQKGLYMVTAVPILIGNRKFALELIQDVTEGMYLDSGTPEQELQKLTSLLAMKMDELVSKDKLTGLFNRRFIDERLPAELKVTRQTNQPLSLIFADLDFFKKINDEYGHLAGDEVLRQFAARLEESHFGDNAWLARYGGEEFLICLPGACKKQALKAAEQIRIATSEKPFTYGKENLNLTCSLGVHTVNEHEKDIDVVQVLHILDKNLYRAKNDGRNCIRDSA